MDGEGGSDSVIKLLRRRSPVSVGVASPCRRLAVAPRCRHFAVASASRWHRVAVATTSHVASSLQSSPCRRLASRRRPVDVGQSRIDSPSLALRRRSCRVGVAVAFAFQSRRCRIIVSVPSTPPSHC